MFRETKRVEDNYEEKHNLKSQSKKLKPLFTSKAKKPVTVYTSSADSTPKKHNIKIFKPLKQEISQYFYTPPSNKIAYMNLSGRMVPAVHSNSLSTNKYNVLTNRLSQSYHYNLNFKKNKFIKNAEFHTHGSLENNLNNMLASSTNTGNFSRNKILIKMEKNSYSRTTLSQSSQINKFNESEGKKKKEYKKEKVKEGKIKSVQKKRSPSQTSSDISSPKVKSKINTPNSPSKNVNWTAIFNSTYYQKIIAWKPRNYEEAKYGTKSHGRIISYGANTYQGMVRNYNEDRVSIILNVIKPISRKEEEWPPVSYFAIYDGHGGNKCADFLKDNLHQYIFREKCFPADPAKAINKGFKEAEQTFILENKPKNLINDYNRSGSCAIVVIIVDNMCYVANLGDSRALLSENCGENISLISSDHKPNDPEERKRIEAAGGNIYQGVLPANDNFSIRPSKPLIINTNITKLDTPWRIFPGKLSVARSFGDLEAKVPELGGNPKVLISQPQIVSFKITNFTDFIILGSDGIFDKMSNKEIIQAVWSSCAPGILSDSIYKHCSRVVDIVMKNSLQKQTMDNITTIFICFNNFKRVLFDDRNYDVLKSIIEGVNHDKGDYELKENDELGISQEDENEDFGTIKEEIYKITKPTNKKKNISLKTFNLGPETIPSTKTNNSNNLSSKYSSYDNMSKTISKKDKSLPNVFNFSTPSSKQKDNSKSYSNKSYYSQSQSQNTNSNTNKFKYK